MIDLALRFCLVALTTSLGWAIRGVWGHWWGETAVGALCGMSIWLAFGESGNAWQMLVFGAVIALSHSVGGDISYGQIVAYVVGKGDSRDEEGREIPQRSPGFGLFAIFLVGGMIGFYPATALGLLMRGASYGLDDLALWAVLASLGAFLAYKLLVLGLGLRLSPPRSDYWAATLGGAVSTMAYFAAMRDLVVLGTGLLGWFGYGGGFVAGLLLHRKAVRAGWRVDSWKWMEHSVGFFGGISLASSVALFRSTLAALPLSRPAVLASAIVVFWFVPYMVLSDNFEYWAFERRVISRRAFAAFHAASLASLPVFIMVVGRIMQTWAGALWHRWPFVLGIWLYVLIAILKPFPVLGGGLGGFFGFSQWSRCREWTIVRGTFLAMGFACTILGLLL